MGDIKRVEAERRGRTACSKPPEWCSARGGPVGPAQSGDSTGPTCTGWGSGLLAARPSVEASTPSSAVVQALRRTHGHESQQDAVDADEDARGFIPARMSLTLRSAWLLGYVQFRTCPLSDTFLTFDLFSLRVNFTGSRWKIEGSDSDLLAGRGSRGRDPLTTEVMVQAPEPAALVEQLQRGFDGAWLLGRSGGNRP
jgi:hypothetical protein